MWLAVRWLGQSNDSLAWIDADYQKRPRRIKRDDELKEMTMKHESAPPIDSIHRLF
jgi:hypothetical protein